MVGFVGGHQKILASKGAHLKKIREKRVKREKEEKRAT